MMHTTSICVRMEGARVLVQSAAVLSVFARASALLSRPRRVVPFTAERRVDAITCKDNLGH